MVTTDHLNTFSELNYVITTYVYDNSQASRVIDISSNTMFFW